MGRQETSIPTVRVAAAMAVSLAFHTVAALLLASHGWRPAPGARPSVVLVRVLGDAGGAAPRGNGESELPRSAGAAGVSSPPEPVLAPADRLPERPRPVARRVPRAATLALEQRAPAREDASPSGEQGALAAAPSGAAHGELGGSGGAEGGSRVGGNGGGAGEGRAGGADGLRAWCRSCPIPDYPPRARRQGWQGTVDVDLRVSSDGTVERASVGRSSGFALLDSAAVSVARQSRFRLPEGGQGLRGQLRYRFVLEDAGTERSL